MNSAQLFALETDANAKIAAVQDPAVKAALEAILKIAKLYPDSKSTVGRGGA